MSGPGATAAVLALDASTLTAGAALVDREGEVMGRWSQPAGSRGTATLAPAVADLLADQGFAVSDLLGLVVGTGPGSYTGLRAAIAFTRALAFAAGLPLAGVPSVAAAAGSALGGRGAPREVVVVVDARRGQVYRADYRRAAEGRAAPVEVAPPRLVPAGEVSALEATPHAARAVLREPVPDPVELARIGRPRLERGGDDPATVAPLYLKRSHAEIALDERARSR